MWDLGLLEWLRTRIYRQRAVTAILYLNDGGDTWDCKAKVGGLVSQPAYHRVLAPSQEAHRWMGGADAKAVMIDWRCAPPGGMPSLLP